MWKLTLTALMVLLVGFAVAQQHPTAETGKSYTTTGPITGMQIAVQSGKNLESKTENVVTDEAQSGKGDAFGKFDVTVGQEFSLTLASNPTTGYRWELADHLDEAIVKLVASEFKAPQTTLIGAGGQEIWTFRAAGRGETVISLKYVRPWEQDGEPAQTASYKVTVR
jgi:inhibitor of cysteine peptidase